MSAAATEKVLQLVSNLAGELRAGAPPPRARVDDDLERDLGFDSLERAELLRRVEKKFDVRLPARTLATAQTPRDLVRAVCAGDGAADLAGHGAEDAPSRDAGAQPAEKAFAPTVAAPGQAEESLDNRASSDRKLGIRIGELLFAGYAWALLFTLGLGALAAVVALPRLAWRRHVVHAVARGFVAASGIPIRVAGADRMPARGPITVVANHASYLDAIVLTTVLPTRCSFIAKRELEENLATRLLLGRIGTHFVERVDAQARWMAAQEIAALAKRRQSFVFFAEGTFTSESGLRPFRMGAFVAAASAETPVIPVAIRGTRAVLREGEWVPRRGQIEISVSAPILPDGSDWDAAVRLRNRTRAAILAACGERDLANNEWTPS